MVWDFVRRPPIVCVAIISEVIVQISFKFYLLVALGHTHGGNIEFFEENAFPIFFTIFFSLFVNIDPVEQKISKTLLLQIAVKICQTAHEFSSEN